MTMIAFAISLLLISPITAQNLDERPNSEARVQQIVQELEAEKVRSGCERKNVCGHLEDFLRALKQGDRGDGIRLGWMIKLRQFEVKQVEFEFEFSWHKDGVHFQFRKIDYFRRYYARRSLVSDGELLRRIKKEGIERELKEFVTAYLKTGYGKYREGNVKKGDDNITLFEDEALPVTSWVY